MYSFPSASQMRGPCPLLATTGVPPTPPNARTGEFTPPGKSSAERRIISVDLSPITANCNRSHRQTSTRRGRHRLHFQRDHAHNRRIEVVIIDNVLDSDLEKSSRRVHLVEVRNSVNIVCLPRETTNRDAIGDAVNNQLRACADARLVPLRRNRALQLSETLESLALHRLRHVIHHLGRLGHFLW